MMLKCFLFSDLIPKTTWFYCFCLKACFSTLLIQPWSVSPSAVSQVNLGWGGHGRGSSLSLTRRISSSTPVCCVLALVSGLCNLLFRCTLPWHAGDAIAMNISGALHIPGTAEMPASSDSLCGPPCSENSNKRTRLVRRLSFSEGSGGFKLDPTVMNPLTVLISGEKNWHPRAAALEYFRSTSR